MITSCFTDYEGALMHDKLRIIQVTPYFGNLQYGGTERFVMGLSEQIVKRGHHVDVFTTKNSKKVPYQEYYLNLTVHRFYSPWDVFGVNPACIMIHKLLKNKDIDVIHIHSHIYFTSIQAAFTKLIKGIPILLHIHGGVGRPPYKTSFTRDFTKMFFDYTLGKFVLSQADLIVSVSEKDIHNLSKIHGISKSKLILINNAIDMNKFPKVNPKLGDQFIISYIGDLEAWKGIIFYAKVVKSLLKKYKHTHFWFIGDGLLYNKLVNYFKNETRVKFFGKVHHNVIPKLLAETNVLVQPSYWEGSPTSIIEALSMGIPVVAANVGDIPRLLRFGKAGTLFMTGNEKDLIEKLDLAINSYDDLIKKVKAYRDCIRNSHDLTKIATKILKIYYSLVKR